jgi:hypothetical protein
MFKFIIYYFSGESVETYEDSEEDVIHYLQSENPDIREQIKSIQRYSYSGKQLLRTTFYNTKHDNKN